MAEKKLNSIQIIRAVAFIAIFLSHVEVTSTGAFGVSVFFVLSGFCSIYSCYSKKFKVGGGIRGNLSFAVKKIKKLYPLHLITLLAVAAMLLLVDILHRNFDKNKIGYFIANIFLIQSWLPFSEGYFSFNAVSWYLSDMLFLYFLFPWFFCILKKNRKRAIQIGIVLIFLQFLIALLLFKSPEVWFSENITKWITYICPLYRAGDFLAGCIAGYAFIIKKNRLNLKIATAVECVIIVVIILQVYIYTRYDFWQAFKFDLFWIFTSAVFISVFASCDGLLSRMFSKSKSLVFIGNVSAQTFLIHQIVIGFYSLFISNKFILTVVSLASTLIGAVVYLKLESIIISRVESVGKRAFGG